MTAVSRLPLPHLRCATLHTARISPKTIWCFVQLCTYDGLTGEAEATLNGQEDALTATAARLFPALLPTARPLEPWALAEKAAPADLPQAAIISAIDQALWSLHAQRLQQPLAKVLAQHAAQGLAATPSGASPSALREHIPVYANINRRTVLRSPQGFAQSAATAQAAGFNAYKLAPFDEVNTSLCAQGNGVQAMQAGLARVAAVREVVGPQARLMVDCHWRFDEATARHLNDAAAALGVYWVECPLPEVPENIPALTRLRTQANAQGVRLAGLEENIGWDSFRPYCEAGAYDVVMPDVKYVGGMAEMLRLAQHCAALGVQVSPHNPSGPICHAASLHLASVLPAFDMLEMQFDESPLFQALVTPAFAPIEHGQTVLPKGHGLGLQLHLPQLQMLTERVPLRWEA
ncbi:mandelate racemase/muconate lactonizing enzyme family protein [Variovorax sp. HJSM1_2]|uniref:mandelate racemase/muconate lactonizing enzyme family protein n=1 Tax=Variovorax sp. HJSM1_2 TaxID=3366263 RepID=UPI003BDBCA60